MPGYPTAACAAPGYPAASVRRAPAVPTAPAASTASAPAAPLQSQRRRNRCTYSPLLCKSRLYTSAQPVTSSRLRTPHAALHSAPLHLCICTPCAPCALCTLCTLSTRLHFCSPLHPCASAPLHPCTPAPLRLHPPAGLLERDRCAWRVRRRGDRHSGVDGDGAGTGGGRYNSW
jgi:hypothetical protein